MHRPQLSALASVAMVLLCACQRDYSFHTVAVYDAPASRCSVRMEAKGVVRAGADLSDQSTGLLEVHPMAEAGPARAPVTLRVA
jgi:hypothetical protein